MNPAITKTGSQAEGTQYQACEVCSTGKLECGNDLLTPVLTCQ